jgi:hypothetical protein
MGKINVICATAAKPNPGMASVDLAFHALAARHGFADQTTFWQLGTATELHAGKAAREQAELASREALPFAYQNAWGRLEEIGAGDAIVFWGDFQHMAHYRQDIGGRLAKLNLVPTAEAGIKWADRLFLLSKAPDAVLAKTISCGTNLLFNQAADYQDPDYGPLLHRFVKGIGSIWMRDPFSAMAVSRIRQEFTPDHLGFDCSLFLREDDLKPLSRQWTLDPALGQGKVGLFFHRSSLSESTLCGFALELCKELDAEAQWLPWRMPSQKRASQLGWGNFFRIDQIKIDTPPTLGDLYELLRRYRLVITDTYHVCVNAWRLGIPAVCIGETDPKCDWDVSAGPAFAWREKRQIFHAMYDAQDFFVHASELNRSSWRRQRIRQLASLLQRPEIAAGVRQRLLAQRDSVEKDLVHSIRRLVVGK